MSIELEWVNFCLHELIDGLAEYLLKLMAMRQGIALSILVRY